MEEIILATKCGQRINKTLKQHTDVFYIPVPPKLDKPFEMYAPNGRINLEEMFKTRTFMYKGKVDTLLSLRIFEEV